MTIVVFGLDGLDATDSHLIEQPTHQLDQDFEGDNALWTYRVWPCIFSGSVYGERNDFITIEYHSDAPTPYIWEKFPATVMLAPIERPRFSKNQSAFPEDYRESTKPPGRLQETFDRIEEGMEEAFANNVPLVVVVARAPDIVQHATPNGWENWLKKHCEQASKWCDKADEWLIVSDHGFNEPGTKGLKAHSRRATFGSSFCDYDSMTEFCEGWHDDLAAALRQQQMDDLGYL